MDKLELKRFYNRVRILYYMLAIKALRKKRYPFYTNLVINNVCGMKCSYCFGNYHSRQPNQISLDKFKQLVDLLYSKGTSYILLQGGEPLIHPHFSEFLRYLNSKNIINAIVSNGQFPELIKNIPELNYMDNICFSLDGNKDGNDKVRKNSFDKVIVSIDEVKKYYKVPIRINTTLHKFVLQDIDFLAEFVKKNKLEWGINFLFIGTEQAMDGEKLALSKEETIYAISKILEYKKKRYPIFTTTKVLKYALCWTEYTDKVFLAKSELTNFPKPIECQYGNYEIAIDEDLRLYPCQALQNIFPAKSIETDGFDNAFEFLLTKPCYSCRVVSMINTSAMINWDFEIILETIFDTIRNRFIRD